MTTDAVPSTIAGTVIGNDQESLRFEKFCVSILNLVEPDKELVRTSPSWDLGRDARSIRGKERLFVCCTLAERLEGKIQDDLRRLSDTTKQIDILYFCCSAALSEHRQRELETEIRKALPKVSSVHLLSNYQLAELAERYPETVRRYYGPELEAIKSFISDDSAVDDAELEGLRLALYGFGSESSSALRSELYKSLLLTILADGTGRTSKRCCKEAGEKLRLSRSLPEPPIVHYLKVLESAAFTTSTGDLFTIAEKGREEIKKLNINAASELLHGRNLIRERLEKLLGYKQDTRSNQPNMVTSRR